MKREIFVHLSFFISFFIFISILRGWFELVFLAFWLGGAVGTLLPDLDHLVYIYVRDNELTSLRVASLLDRRKVREAFSLLADTRAERKNLIFHSLSFQVVFLVLAFWVLTSSGNLFGRGLVLGFLIHLVVDQLVDLLETGSLDNWLSQSPIHIQNDRHLWLWTGFFLLVAFFGFIL